MKNKKVVALLTIIFTISLLNIIGVEAYQQSRGQGVKGQGVNRISTDSRKRTALVIGNSTYKDSPLRNPVNDAQDIANTLAQLGFSVELVKDATLKRMGEAIASFGDKMDSNTVALFYYAGHGVQSKGQNYLIPVNAEIAKESELDFNAIDVEKVLKTMENAQTPLNIVILDACRNNPFAHSFARGTSGGLASITNAPTGTMIMYSTAPGKTASDGDGRNGLYTQELLKVIKTPGIGVYDVFSKVTTSVSSLTNKGQVPWISSSFGGTFSFAGSDETVGNNNSSDSSPSNNATNSATKEETYWNSVDKTDIDELKTYLIKYPNGEYSDLARTKIKKLEAATSATNPSKPAETTSNTNSSNANNSSSPTAVTAGTAMGADPLVDKRMTGEFVRIPAGNFTMGSSNGESDERPEHEVVISRGFEMGKYEVTQEQWEAVMGSNPSYFKGEGRLPVEQVSWEEVQKFISELNGRSRKYTYRLPTEAEWEYAARAGSRGEYGGNLEAMGWYKDNSGGKTHVVGGKQANAFGLYDMHGNVWEWCSDWYGNYSSGTATDPRGAISGSFRVFRGGSCYSSANFCRSANRGSRIARLPQQLHGFPPAEDS